VSFLGDVARWFREPGRWSGDEGIPHLAWQHLQITLAAMLVAAVLAVTIGVVLGHYRRGGAVAVNVANVGRALPTLAILILAVLVIGNRPRAFPLSLVGSVPVWISLVLLAIPPMLINSYVAIAEIDPEIREAASGMGLDGRQLLLHVELPLATPLIMAGVRTSAVAVVATATLAAYVGFGGLGRPVVDGFATFDRVETFAGALLVAVFALLVELVLALVQRLLTPRGLRRGVHSVGRRASPAGRAGDDGAGSTTAVGTTSEPGSAATAARGRQV